MTIRQGITYETVTDSSDKYIVSPLATPVPQLSIMPERNALFQFLATCSDCEAGTGAGMRFGVMGQAHGDFPLPEIAKECGGRDTTVEASKRRGKNGLISCK